MFFKPKKRIQKIGNRYIPQILTSRGYEAINEKGELWLTHDLQVKYCALDSEYEAQELLNLYRVISFRKMDITNNKLMEPPHDSCTCCDEDNTK